MCVTRGLTSLCACCPGCCVRSCGAWCRVLSCGALCCAARAAQLLRAVYKEAQRDETVLDVRVEEPTDIFSALQQALEQDMLVEHDLLHPLRSATPPWLHMQVDLCARSSRLQWASVRAKTLACAPQAAVRLAGTPPLFSRDLTSLACCQGQAQDIWGAPLPPCRRRRL